MRHVIVLIALCGSAWAGEYTAASCERDVVNALINGPGEDATHHVAVDGDVINIPAGTCTWTSGIAVTAGIGITIRGTGTPSSDSATFGPSASCTQTVINDASTSISPRNMFRFEPSVTSSTTRLSCMKMLIPDTGLADNSIQALVTVGGACNAETCPSLRLDNITFDAVNGDFQGPLAGGALMVVDNVFGVVDHNYLVGKNQPPASIGITFLMVQHTSWKGVGDYGDNSWASPSSAGTAQTIFLENNYLGTGVVVTENEQQGLNGRGGGRMAVRFNNLDGILSGVSSHGTESDGRDRGSRQFEVYGNSFVCGNAAGGCQAAMPIRSGTGYMFANSITTKPPATYWNGYIGLATYRMQQAFSPWGVCDGSGAYDTNDWVVYDSGTVTSVSGTITITDTSKSWGTNAWIPSGAIYALHNTSRTAGAQITGNTLNTVTVKGWTQTPNFQAGDGYQILRASACIDQPGRSGGSLLSGLTPSPTNADGGWQGQTLDPLYEWNNSGYNPVFGNVSAGGWSPSQIANKDWYSDNSGGTPQAQTSASSPFNGTSGVGFGTLARRPTSCTTGVGYYATDQGTWNLSGNAFGQGQLYKCTAPDTWTLSYTPYTYPHPLQEASPELPSTTSRTGGASRIGGSGRF
jgi:hypothetical protein